MTNNTAQRALISCEPVSSHIITAHFNTRHSKIVMNVIQCCAPNNEPNERDHTGFYDLLQSTTEKAERSDLVMVIMGMNEKRGSRNDNSEVVMGRHGLRTIDDDGQFCVYFCSLRE